ncbi:MAG: alanyl-tRNA editing protein [Cellulosilyticaceae bacterium]
MTDKLYYKNSYMKKFKGHVRSCEPIDGNYRVELDQSAFYPGGGGQPCDLGTLNGLAVLGVYEEEDKIYHIIEQPLQIGIEVIGEIDFENRFDYMQQHSGEHILSGIINKLYGFNNVGFHLSKQYMTADLDGELTKEQLAYVEQLVNEAICENKTISAVVYQGDKLAEQVYRSKIELKGEVRLVTVEDCDCCACCGTHVRGAGEIGLLKTVSAEKYKGGMRLTLLCGRRALRDYQQKCSQLGELSQLLSAKSGEVVASVLRIKEESNAFKQKLVERTMQLLEQQADQYVKDTETFIVREDLTIDELRKLCSMLCERGSQAYLVVGSDEKGLRYLLGSQTMDIRDWCKQLNTLFQGRGGGNQNLCQGTLQVDLQTLEDYWRGLDE